MSSIRVFCEVRSWRVLVELPLLMMTFEAMIATTSAGKVLSESTRLGAKIAEEMIQKFN
jgi:hypothetical protein